MHVVDGNKITISRSNSDIFDTNTLERGLAKQHLCHN